MHPPTACVRTSAVCRLVDWQPTYGNVESLLVQICAFLAHSNARVASLVAKGGGSAGASAPSVPAEELDDAAQRAKAQQTYEQLKAFHQKKGWSARHDQG